MRFGLKLVFFFGYKGVFLGVNFKFENEMLNLEFLLFYFNKKKIVYFFVKLFIVFYMCLNSFLCILLYMYKWILNLISFF